MAESLVFRDLHIVYMVVPKAGMKSVNAALHAHSRMTPWIPKHRDSTLDAVMRLKNSTGRHYFWMTVVRHPIERFESFFYDQVNDGRIDAFAWGFPDSTRAQEDPHAMRQVDLIGEDLGYYDLIGRTENMDAVSGRLSEFLGREVTIGHHHRSRRGPKLEGGALRLIAEHYERDFELLGYERP